MYRSSKQKNKPTGFLYTKSPKIVAIFHHRCHPSHLWPWWLSSCDFRPSRDSEPSLLVLAPPLCPVSKYTFHPPRAVPGPKGRNLLPLKIWSVVSEPCDPIHRILLHVNGQTTGFFLGNGWNSSVEKSHPGNHWGSINNVEFSNSNLSIHFHWKKWLPFHIRRRPTPPKTNMEPENTPLAKEKYRPKLPFFGFHVQSKMMSKIEKEPCYSWYMIV